MKINPYIFAGLKEPKGELLTNIKKLIADNGGRLFFAQKLECEIYKTYKPPRLRKKFNFSLYTEDEMDMIRNRTVPPGRSIYSVYRKRYMMKKLGLL